MYNQIKTKNESFKLIGQGPLLVCPYSSTEWSTVLSPHYRWLLADDILLYKVIAWPTDHLNFAKQNLNTSTKWESDWLMEFNIPKCSIPQFTLHHDKSFFTNKMSDVPLCIRLHHKFSWIPTSTTSAVS